MLLSDLRACCTSHIQASSGAKRVPSRVLFMNIAENGATSPRRNGGNADPCICWKNPQTILWPADPVGGKANRRGGVNRIRQAEVRSELRTREILVQLTKKLRGSFEGRVLAGGSKWIGK